MLQKNKEFQTKTAWKITTFFSPQLSAHTCSSALLRWLFLPNTGVNQSATGRMKMLRRLMWVDQPPPYYYYYYYCRSPEAAPMCFDPTDRLPQLLLSTSSVSAFLFTCMSYKIGLLQSTALLDVRSLVKSGTSSHPCLLSNLKLGQCTPTWCSSHPSVCRERVWEWGRSISIASALH